MAIKTERKKERKKERKGEGEMEMEVVISGVFTCSSHRLFGRKCLFPVSPLIRRVSQRADVFINAAFYHMGKDGR